MRIKGRLGFKKSAAASLTLAMAVMLAGCPAIQNSARDGIATAKGFLDQERVSHPECASGSVSQVCTLIARGVHAKDVTIDALEQYCSGVAFDSGAGTCTPNAPLKDKLNAALRDLDQIISDIKKLPAH